MFPRVSTATWCAPSTAAAMASRIRQCWPLAVQPTVSGTSTRWRLSPVMMRAESFSSPRVFVQAKSIVIPRQKHLVLAIALGHGRLGQRAEEREHIVSRDGVSERVSPRHLGAIGGRELSDALQ